MQMTLSCCTLLLQNQTWTVNAGGSQWLHERVGKQFVWMFLFDISWFYGTIKIRNVWPQKVKERLLHKHANRRWQELRNMNFESQRRWAGVLGSLGEMLYFPVKFSKASTIPWSFSSIDQLVPLSCGYWERGGTRPNGAPMIPQSKTSSNNLGHLSVMGRKWELIFQSNSFSIFFIHL